MIDASEGTIYEAEIGVSKLMVAEIVLYSKVADQSFVARVDSRFNIEAGETVQLAFNLSNGHFFDKATEERIKL